MQEAELTYIEGTVDAVIYQNRENGYTVLRLDAGEGRGLTVVGCLPGVAPGESISVQGTWMHHASYGGAVQGRGGGAADARRHQGHL
ncbi:hypothetical protein M5E87_27410 [Flavonifractor plautii]|nr:hypothetical protein M5E87_27410 [Flavonifractor plautii]